jgi:NDP-sugar pyrophosphorylase family protein
VNVEEKPDFKFEILSGIYILKPALFDIIPDDTYYGIDTLIKDLLARKMKVGRYLMHEYWLDIGRVNDYEAAQAAYKEHFKGTE